MYYVLDNQIHNNQRYSHCSIKYSAKHYCINATNYYASDIGFVYSDVVFQYELEDLSQFNIELPIPESATINSTQSITDWNVVLED